jgi:hypothetical protein
MNRRFETMIETGMVPRCSPGLRAKAFAGDRGGDGSEHPPAAHVTTTLSRLTFSRERGSDTAEAGVKYVSAYAARGLREPDRLRDRDASGTRERL